MLSSIRRSSYTIYFCVNRLYCLSIITIITTMLHCIRGTCLFSHFVGISLVVNYLYKHHVRKDMLGLIYSVLKVSTAPKINLGIIFIAARSLIAKIVLHDLLSVSLSAIANCFSAIVQDCCHALKLPELSSIIPARDAGWQSNPNSSLNVQHDVHVKMTDKLADWQEESSLTNLGQFAVVTLSQVLQLFVNHVWDLRILSLPSWPWVYSRRILQ